FFCWSFGRRCFPSSERHLKASHSLSMHGCGAPHVDLMYPSVQSLTRCSRIRQLLRPRDRKSTRLNSSHRTTSYAVFCLKKNNQQAKWNGLLFKRGVAHGELRALRISFAEETPFHHVVTRRGTVRLWHAVSDAIVERHFP